MRFFNTVGLRNMQQLSLHASASSRVEGPGTSFIIIMLLGSGACNNIPVEFRVGRAEAGVIQRCRLCIFADQ